MADKYVVKNEYDRTVIERETTDAEKVAAVGAAAVALYGMKKVSDANALRRQLDHGISLIEDGRHFDALEVLTPLTGHKELDTRCAAQFFRSKAYIELEQYTNAREDLEHVLIFSKNNTDFLEDDQLSSVHWMLGRCAQNLDNLGVSIQHFTEMIRLEPNLDHGYYYRARALMHIEDFERARRDIDHTLDLGPGDAMNYRLLADFLEQQGDVNGAIGALDRAIRLKNDMPQAYFHRAKLHANTSSNAGALEDVSRAIELSNHKPKYYALRSRIHLALGNSESSSADAKHSDRLFRITEAASIYLSRSRELWDSGLSEVYSETDTIGKNSLFQQGRTAVWGFLLFFIGAALLGVDSWLIILLAAIAGSLGLWYSRQKETATKRSNAENYLESVQAAERDLPGFSTFYPLFIEYGPVDNIKSIFSTILPLFDDDGPCNIG